MQKKITNFIESIAKLELQNTNNPYHNEIRKNNLKLYLTELADKKAKILLVGEAPGYQGCRLTGIAFTSEHTILTHEFFKNKGYKKTDEYEKIWKEPSGTILWNTIENLNQPILVWNSFPLHPYKQGNIHSNRKPTREESIMGSKYLKEIIDIFKIEKVLALGNTAKESLDKLGIKSVKIRHPSYGGKNDFVKGIKENLD